MPVLCFPRRTAVPVAALAVLAAAPVRGQGAVGDSLATRLRYPITVCVPVDAQTPALRDCPPEAYLRDGAALRAVYRTRSPVLRATFRAADATSYAAFVAVPAAMAASALATDGSLRPALATFAAEGAAAVVVTGLKRHLRRERPYLAEPDIAPRVDGVRVHAIGDRSFSLPSGHSALAFATATSVALAHPRAALPAYGWATTVAAARLWHGVHYASDVLAGAALGFVAGAAAHVVIGR